MADMRERVREMIETKFLAGREVKLSDDDSLLEQGVIDSLGMMELVELLSSRFGVTVTDDELSPDNLDSIDALTQYLEGKGAAA